MKPFLTLTAGLGSLAVVALLLLSFNANAQEEAGGMMGGHHQGMMSGQHQAMMEGKEAESKPMMMRTRMLMTMHVNPLDPDAVLSLKDQLKLTDDQVQRLEDIAGEAREKTRAVLTEDQKSELAALEKTPDNSMAMHRMMMMHQGHGKPGMMQGDQKGKAGGQCPMIHTMQNMMGRTQKGEAHSGESAQP